MNSQTSPLFSETAFTLAHMDDILSKGCRAIEQGEQILDLGGFTQVDSTAVSALLTWQRIAQQKKQALSFRNPPDNLMSLVSLYGVEQAFHFSRS